MAGLPELEAERFPEALVRLGHAIYVGTHSDDELEEGICEAFHDMLMDYGYDKLARQFRYCWKKRRANYCDVPQRVGGCWYAADDPGGDRCWCKGSDSSSEPHREWEDG